MLNEFSRTQLLYGKDAMAKLAQSRIAVFGIGGVGGYVVEALARSGVGALDLIDHDVRAQKRKAIFAFLFNVVARGGLEPSTPRV